METGAVQQQQRREEPRRLRGNRPDRLDSTRCFISAADVIQRLERAEERSASPRRRSAMTEEGEERGGLRRKLTGPPRLLLGRTRTRSSGEDRPDSKQMEISGETSARCSDAAEEIKDLETHHNAGPRRRHGWWSRFSSAGLWIRKKEARKGLEKPPEEVPLRGEKGGEVVFKEKRFLMRRMFRTFRTSTADQHNPSQSRGRKTPRSLQKKLQKLFIRGGKRQSVPTETTQHTKVEEDQFVSELIELQKKETDGTLEVVTVPVEMKDQLMEDLASEDPQSPTETPEDDSPDVRDKPEPIQTADKNQVLLQVVSSEEDKVFCSSKVTVDLHDQLPYEEKTPQASRPFQPATNGPSIQIKVCPPEETEDDECWEGCSSSENHLLLLLGFHHNERQLVQMAHSLVQTAMAAAVDQITRELQVRDQHQIQRHLRTFKESKEQLRTSEENMDHLVQSAVGT